MAVIFQEWLNANEQRAYPVHDRADRLDMSGQILPHNILVDASIWVPASAGGAVYISSIGITERLVSLTLCAAPEGAFCGSSSSSSSAFVPIASVGLVRPVSRFRNVAISPLYPGVGGWVAFGSAVDGDTVHNYRFDGPEATQLLDRVLRYYDDLPVISTGKVSVATRLTGLVRLRGADGAIKTYKDTRLIDGQSRDVGVIALDLDEDGVETLQEFAGTCGHRPHDNTCNRRPIISIDGVTPDCDGNIDFVFDDDTIVGDAQDGIIFDFPLGLLQICPGNPFLTLPSDYGDVCGPSWPSQSGSFPTEPPEPPSSSLSSNPALPSEFCEDFEGVDFGELVVLEGGFSLDTGGGANTQRMVSNGPAFLGPQLAVAEGRLLDVSVDLETYIVEGTIRPRTDLLGGGHLVVGFNNEDNFFFAGLTLRTSGAHPNGHFFIGDKSLTGPVWPDGLGYGYNFVAGAQFDPPSGAVLDLYDYRVHVMVTNVGSGLAQIRMIVDWNDGTARNVDVSALVPNFNFQGYAGLGCVDSETEFDDYGINCGGSSSSF